MRLAILRLEAGEPVDPMTLRSAATAVLWNAGHLLAESLSQTVSAQPVPLGSEGGVALRLARAAWEQSGDIPSGIELSVVYAWIGQVDNAALILETVEARAANEEERAEIAAARATLLFWGLGRPADAIAVLQDAEAECRSIVGTASHRELARARAGIELNIARPHQALEISEAIIAAGPDDLATARARPTIAAALAMIGRCDDALSFVDTFLPAAIEQLDTSPLIAGQLLTARNGALMRLGRVAESNRLAEQCLSVALEGESIDGVAVFESWAGRARLGAGDVQGARRHLVEAEALFAERDPLVMRVWTSSLIAQAAVWENDLATARRALTDAEATRRCDRFFDGDLHLARVLFATAERRTHDAVAAVDDAVEWARAAEMPVEEAIAWHAAVRLGRAESSVAPLTALSARLRNPFVAALAAHARAVGRTQRRRLGRGRRRLRRVGSAPARGRSGDGRARRLRTARRNPSRACARATVRRSRPGVYGGSPRVVEDAQSPAHPDEARARDRATRGRRTRQPFHRRPSRCVRAHRRQPSVSRVRQARRSRPREPRRCARPLRIVYGTQHDAIVRAPG